MGSNIHEHHGSTKEHETANKLGIESPCTPDNHGHKTQEENWGPFGHVEPGTPASIDERAFMNLGHQQPVPPPSLGKFQGIEKEGIEREHAGRAIPETPNTYSRAHHSHLQK